MARREYKSDQRSREQHFNNCYIPIIAAKYLRKRICVVYLKAAGRSWAATLKNWQIQSKTYVPLTNCQAAVVLVKGHKIHSHGEGIAAYKAAQRAFLGQVCRNYRHMWRDREVLAGLYNRAMQRNFDMRR